MFKRCIWDVHSPATGAVRGHYSCFTHNFLVQNASNHNDSSALPGHFSRAITG